MILGDRKLSHTHWKKVFNDPIYGLISVNNAFIFELIEHRYFQRLRRISQLGLANFVYTSALHTRFQHSMGAMYLAQESIKVLRGKGVDITPKEEEAVLIAILLHDIGHGPFSHSLEKNIINVHHEHLSLALMQKLNEEFSGRLSEAIKIFSNTHEKKFLNQLISGEIDMDRMDYLKRDSYFTGVYEGVIGTDRIISVLNIKNDDIVVEEKGINSIVNFLTSRMIMYLQVYCHKASISADFLLNGILKRAKELVKKGVSIEGTEYLDFFLYQDFSKEDFYKTPKLLDAFIAIDDSDIIYSIKKWTKHPDKILSDLSQRFINRNLFRVSFVDQISDKTRKKIQDTHSISKKEENSYYFASGELDISFYEEGKNGIKFLMKSGEVIPLQKAVKVYQLPILLQNIKKRYICQPK